MKLKKRTRVCLIILAVGLLMGLALPVSNLVIALPSSQKLTAASEGEPLFAEVHDVIQGKCSHCHTDDAGLPFYASLPGASGPIQQDVERGLLYLDIPASFKPGAKILSEPALAKIEYAVTQGTMPPLPYVMMHWNTSLSTDEEQAVLNWVRKTRATHYADSTLAAELQQSTIRPLPLKHAEDAAKVALGKLLFNDKRLSKDGSISCASCHELDRGGTDQEAVATGVGNQKGPINSPTVFNAMYNVKQFWDGRAKDLQDQAAGPVENPIEMAEKWDNVIKKLKADTAFTTAFEKIYPAGLSKETATHAIAVFERTLVTPNSPFDKFLRGDEAALSTAEQAGYTLFQDNGCATCHCGEALGGQSFEKMGRDKDYFAERGSIKKEDHGLFNVTQSESDRHKFKVPTLRNIALTFPYFHDAAAKDLASAVKTMADVQNGRELSADEIAKVVSFLKTLTGEYEGKSLAVTPK